MLGTVNRIGMHKSNIKLSCLHYLLSHLNTQVVAIFTISYVVFHHYNKILNITRGKRSLRQNLNYKYGSRNE